MAELNILKVLFTLLHKSCDAADSNGKISYANFQVTSVLTKTSLAETPY